MKLKNTLSAYTEYEFKVLIEEILQVNGTEKYQDELIIHFRFLVKDVGGGGFDFLP